jgi:phage baseplate assembly protein W
MSLRVAFPYALAPTGQTARASEPEYLGQLLAQILFVEPGERVNRPDFGCPLRGLTFATGRSEVTTAVEALVQGALRQWVADAVQIQGVDVDVRGSLVHVTISYLDSRSQALRQIRVSN